MIRSLYDRAIDLQVVHDVAHEQQRERMLKAQGKFQFVAGEGGDEHAFRVLTEELFEAQQVNIALTLNRLMNDGYTDQQLYDELVQVAAVSQSWAAHVLQRIRGGYNASLTD